MLPASNWLFVLGPSATSVVERPTEGLARGRLAAPAWLVGLLSMLLALAAVTLLVRAWRKRGT